MLDHTTIDQLRTLKLDAFATALEAQRAQPDIHAMSFEERLAMLVQREIHARTDRRQTRLLQLANLRYPHACIEDVETRPDRGIERKALMSLALGDWVTLGDTVIFTGPTGVGKSWLACALGQYACRQGHSVRYLRLPRLAEELRLLHGNGQFGKWLIAMARIDVLLLDDWGLVGLDAQTRADLLELIEDRAARKATVITTQLPLEHWHGWIGDATIADAICDRLLQRSHRFNLGGESIRKAGTQDTSARKSTKSATAKAA
jgi:DNA replication protein DnaC